MGDLDELLKRLTIEFPLPITLDELEKGVFNYLQGEVPCGVSYGIDTHVEKSYDSQIEDERDVLRLAGNFARPSESGAFACSSFEMVHEPHWELPLAFFSAIKFQGVPGYDSISEFETQLPSGRDQLKLIDEVREGVQSYFSQRPK